ncbi:MAG TPA: hypothetical protein VKA73_16945, partial [Rubrobacter sp.]|nr:hypothetical protein [Rubrobacter sp.]
MAMTYGLTAPQEGAASGRPMPAATFWLALEDDGPALPLAVALAGGGEALAVFSGEEEARMFCSLREDGPGLRPRRSSAGEIVSLL